ncbi:MAG: CAAX amino terminal protease family [Phormidesmis priestleyi Ana]|uniref:CAAX amino terminal protease family n=1 Tax=Phormidesmis priestleyi Ana TaxID=1666911 RepID=A0A0P8BUA8_9CYAN|nr:MAG: CAAX amino terminal protease family [Phormidesmis priestleyi Ana]
MENRNKSSFHTHLLVFFSLAFAWSWGCWLLSSAVKTQLPSVAGMLFLAGGFGPSLAAIAVVRYVGGRDGLRDWLVRCLQWRVGWRWLALVFFLPLAVMVLAAAAHIALGGTMVPSPAIGHVLLAVVNFVLVLLIGGPLGEEFGWRGYALPALQARYDWRVASLILGAVWGVWHLPLFYIADTAQSYIPFSLFMASTLALSILFAWLFNRTGGSVLPVLVLHTAVNAWSWVIPGMIMREGSSLRPYGLAVGLLVLIALGLLRDAETPITMRKT